MAKRKHRSKRSVGSLPKGLPHKKTASVNSNPFEFQVRKEDIGNRKLVKGDVPKLRRQKILQETLSRRKKASTFVDRRIGEFSNGMTAEEQSLARLVKERSRRSKKSTKYSLNEDSYNDEGQLLTHRGEVIDDEMAKKSVILNDDDDDDGGNLTAMDTALHFGGMGGPDPSVYGPSSRGRASISDNYSQRKTELDDLIARRTAMKVARVNAREQQEGVIADLDVAFKELSSLLQFRDKEKEIRQHIQGKREGKLDKDAREMEDWHQEIRDFTSLGKRAKATDRIKTPEEIAKEESDRLQELETRRLARMTGDLDDMNDSELFDDESSNRDKKKRKKSSSDGDQSDDGQLKAKFTAGGLADISRRGEAAKNLKEGGDGKVAQPSNNAVLVVGARVQGNYRAREQFEDGDHWYDGVIAKVNKGTDGIITYNVDYDDGDFEEDMDPEYVRSIPKSNDEAAAGEEEREKYQGLKLKRQKARVEARQEVPFVFAVPTTLEALHSIFAECATDGNDCSLIIQRIHASNSVKLDRRNAEKMQNFYDVLLRRFMAVGDALYDSGDGGAELGRYQQLDSIAKVLFQMTQDSPDCAAAVWGRRFGVLQNAHAKRLRDSEFERDASESVGENPAWPSLGTVLLLRIAGHIFPASDYRHTIMTPVILFLGQLLSQTPVQCMHDLVMGTICSGLLMEYTKEARRLAPEAFAFLARVNGLFASDSEDTTMLRHSVPTLETAVCKPELTNIGSLVSKYKYDGDDLPSLVLEDREIRIPHKASPGILGAALHFSAAYATCLSSSLGMGGRETFHVVRNSILCIKNKTLPMPKLLEAKINSTASTVAKASQLELHRKPLTRRLKSKVTDHTLKSLSPNLEDPDRYSKSKKGKGKSDLEVTAERTRREYKREHKAFAREIRVDSAFILERRRKEEEAKSTMARAERQKNFSWLEGEQAAMNQQVRQGGGLLKGGGMGAAKSKAKSGKLGIKKGGKF